MRSARDLARFLDFSRFPLGIPRLCDDIPPRMILLYRVYCPIESERSIEFPFLFFFFQSTSGFLNGKNSVKIRPFHPRSTLRYASFSRLGFANLFSWSKKEEFFNNSEELFRESQLLQDSRYLNKFLRI